MKPQGERVWVKALVSAVAVLCCVASGCAGVRLSKNGPKGLLQVGAETNRGPAMAHPKRLRVPSGKLISADGFRWPLKTGSISSFYGRRGVKFHEGLDIRANTGTPIYAAKDGTVIYSGRGIRGYGNLIIVRHDSRMSTIYAHNKKNLVKKGAHVSRGTLIGLVGATGRATGPHLHFEVRVNEEPHDPLSFLAWPSRPAMAKR